MNSGVNFDTSQQVVVRAAEQEDVRALTTAINSSGGLSYYKAIFGAFNLPSLIDTSYLALVVEAFPDIQYWNQSEDSSSRQSSKGVLQGFLSLNDQMSVLPDDYSFESIIALLKDYIPVTVSELSLSLSLSLSSSNTHSLTIFFSLTDQQLAAVQLLDGRRAD
jgi:hypothetical protein